MHYFICIDSRDQHSYFWAPSVQTRALLIEHIRAQQISGRLLLVVARRNISYCCSLHMQMFPAVSPPSSVDVNTLVAVEFMCVCVCDATAALLREATVDVFAMQF